MDAAPTRVLEGTFVVLAGSFNPAIIQPAWLALKGLVRPEEADAAKLELIHPDLTAFSTGWLGLKVEPERFQVYTADPSHYLPLRDLVVGVFTVLEHTPVKALGIIRNLHYRMPDEASWHALGDKLAPKEPWTNVLGPIGRRPDGAARPGLRTVIIEGTREGSAARWVRVKVEPSYRVTPGVYVEVHEHHQADGPDALRKLLAELETEWDAACAFSDRAAQGLLGVVP